MVVKKDEKKKKKIGSNFRNHNLKTDYELHLTLTFFLGVVFLCTRKIFKKRTKINKYKNEWNETDRDDMLMIISI